MSTTYYAVTTDQVLPYVKNIDGIPISELRTALRGPVFTRNEASFTNFSKLFNGALQTPACILVCPVDTKDVSETILFCNRYGLRHSVKSGGYGTHGLSIEGDVIIDMNNIQDVALSTENIPMRGSAMDIVEQGPDWSRNPSAYMHHAYPASKIDAYAPPDLLKRKRNADDEVDGSSESVESPVATAQTAPSIRPSLSSSDGPGSTNASSDMSRSQSSGSKSSHSAKAIQTGTDNEPRSRARYVAPEDYPTLGDQVLAGVAIKGGPQNTQRESIGSPSGSGSTKATSMTSSLAGVSKEQDGPPTMPSVPEGVRQTRATENPSILASGLHNLTETPQVEARPTGPPARGPFSYPSSGRTANVHTGSPQHPDPSASSASSFTTHPIQPSVPFAYVTFGAGASQRQVDAYTTARPLPGRTAVGTPIDVPYYVPFAAHPVGSTVMLLGGFGFQSRLRGFSADALVEVEMVLADGRIVIVNENEHPDLWWAVRGAGTAFGIATRYKAKAYPVPVVYAGNVLYNFNRATAPSLIRHFRDCIKSAPKELYANVILTAGPRKNESSTGNGNRALVVIQICWLGPKEGGMPFLTAILSWSGGQCLLNEVNEKTFANQQDSVAKVLKAAAGRKWFLRADVVTSLTDELVHQSVDRFADTPDGCAWLFELGGGALAEFKDSCIPQAIREGSFNIVAFHQWKIEDYDVQCVESAEQWMQENVNKLSAGGPLPSFFERKELVTRTIGMYGEDNWERLTEVKRKYDPNGNLRHNFWPLDEEGRPIGLAVMEGPLDRELTAEPSKGKPETDPQTTRALKGKDREDRRHGNHFMDRFLTP